jgi:EF-hand domain pair
VSEVRLAEAFDRLDSDDSGYISVENLLEILGETSFAKEDVEEIIREAATDNDGQISYAEFLALWESKHLDEDFLGDPGNHAIVKTVHVERRNAFDSERSAAMSALSSDADDPEISNQNDPLARANFIQGKIMSERNVLFEQERRRTVVLSNNIEVS